MPERYYERREVLKEGDRILVWHRRKWVPATVDSITWRGKSSTTMAKTDDGVSVFLNSDAVWQPVR